MTVPTIRFICSTQDYFLHACKKTCGLVCMSETDSYYVCPISGNYHICKKETCAHSVDKGNQMVCPLTGKTLSHHMFLESFATINQTVKPKITVCGEEELEDATTTIKRKKRRRLYPDFEDTAKALEVLRSIFGKDGVYEDWDNGAYHIQEVVQTWFRIQTSKTFLAKPFSFDLHVLIMTRANQDSYLLSHLQQDIRVWCQRIHGAVKPGVFTKYEKVWKECQKELILASK